MSDVFISHVEEDSAVVLEIARSLEAAGYTTWYYERDSLPGVSYLVQTGQAIDESRTVVLVISASALGSHQVTKEVVRGHEGGKPFLPVLIDVTHADFQSCQPEWREAVGAAASISIAERGMQAVLSAVVRGLEGLGVMPTFRAGSPADKPPREANEGIVPPRPVDSPLEELRRYQRRPTDPPPTLIVSKQGDGSYASINDAIHAAEPGTHILVRPGLYDESLTIYKPLAIIGDGPVNDIVIHKSDDFSLQIQTDYVVVRGVTLRGQEAVAEPRCAVWITEGQPVFEDCDISSDSLVCLGIHGAEANATIRRCKIHDGKQVGLGGTGRGTVEDCDVFGNGGAGVQMEGGGNLIVRRCRIHENGAGVGAIQNSRGTVEDCEIFGNTTGLGVAAQKGSKLRIDGGRITDRILKDY